MDENHPAQVAPPVNPSHKQRAGARLGRPQLPTIVRPPQLAKKIEWNVVFHKEVVSRRLSVISRRQPAFIACLRTDD
jgi:hypothetical protein